MRRQSTVNCSADDCSRPRVSRGLCTLHYQRLKVHGETFADIASMRGTPFLTVEQRFWAKVDKRGPDDCWPWIGSRDQRGYGKFWDPGNSGWRASRFAYALAHGAFAQNLHVLHRCDNPPCVNPAHLFLGTDADNHTDMLNKGRESRGVARHNAILNKVAVADIRIRAAAGVTQSALATEFCVSRSTISLIVTRRRWRHA